MSNMPAPSPEAPSADPFWLRSVRILCACTLLVVLVPWATMLLRNQNGRWTDIVVVLFFSPLWAPFAWVLWRLSTNPDSFILRRALILAASWAFLALLFSSIFLLAIFEDGGSNAPSLAISAGIAILQLLLIFASAKAYFLMPRDRAGFYLLIPRLGSALLVGATALFLGQIALAPKRAVNEASSVGALRTIWAAQTQFAKNHPQLGFATSLAQLGPNPGEELIDGILASGTKSGYTFAITSTTTDSQGRVTKFTAAARPIRYDKRTTRSFLIDESGTFHYTTENRAPTTQDPTLL